MLQGLWTYLKCWGPIHWNFLENMFVENCNSVGKSRAGKKHSLWESDLLVCLWLFQGNVTLASFFELHHLIMTLQVVLSELKLNFIVSHRSFSIRKTINTFKTKQVECRLCDLYVIKIKADRFHNCMCKSVLFHFCKNF